MSTKWAFREVGAPGDRPVGGPGMPLRAWRRPEGRAPAVPVLGRGPQLQPEPWQTGSLKSVLADHGFDAAIGWTKQEGKDSRAKALIFAFRKLQKRWNPDQEHPHLWGLVNGRQAHRESMGVFPLSSRTESDAWQQVRREHVRAAPLGCAVKRSLVGRDAAPITADDQSTRRRPGELPMRRGARRKVQLRRLACNPLSAGIESEAVAVQALIEKRLQSCSSERQGQLLHQDLTVSLERIAKHRLTGCLLDESKVQPEEQLVQRLESLARAGYRGRLRTASRRLDGTTAKCEQGGTIVEAHPFSPIMRRMHGVVGTARHKKQERNMVTGAPKVDVVVNKSWRLRSTCPGCLRSLCLPCVAAGPSSRGVCPGAEDLR